LLPAPLPDPDPVLPEPDPELPEPDPVEPAPELEPDEPEPGPLLPGALAEGVFALFELLLPVLPHEARRTT